MIQELQLRILPEEAVNEQSLKQVVAHETGAQPKDIQAVRVLKRSIDARQRTIYVNVNFRAGRNLPDKEFRYLRTVIVTAAVYRGLASGLRSKANSSA